MTFVNDELTILLNPEDILDATTTKNWQKRFAELAKGSDGARRVDRIAAICTRLFLHVTADKNQENPQHAGNFAEFLLQDAIPNDLRGSLLMDLSREQSPAAKKLLKNKRLAKMLMDKL